MRLAALVSGGKDSVFAAYLAHKEGNEISCIITMAPESEESMMYHYPNTRHVALQAKSMNVPAIHTVSSNSDEYSPLQDALKRAKEQYGIDGIVHGGIHSEYQRKTFASIAKNTSLDVIAPLWKMNEVDYMNSLVDSKFRVIVIGVSSDGLDETWLGRELTTESVKEIILLAKKFGFNPSFEGGEAETFVLDCPLFESPIIIKSSKTIWDGYRGRFEIQEAGLDKHA